MAYVCTKHEAGSCLLDVRTYNDPSALGFTPESNSLHNETAVTSTNGSNLKTVCRLYMVGAYMYANHVQTPSASVYEVKLKKGQSLAVDTDIL
jgi:hypothetical protein